MLFSVVEVLEKHGLQKPILYVKNSQNSEEEAHQLMVKLCRHTGRKYELWKDSTQTRQITNVSRDPLTGAKVHMHVFRVPPVSETAWRGLLQDLLDMQQNVYTCLKPETCHQVKTTGEDYTE